jgi:hypothetical protein
MRGPGRNPQRRGVKIAPTNEAISEVVTQTAPIGGWNTTSALADMPTTDCVIMDNFWPNTERVELRSGCGDHSTGLTGNVETLMGYNGPTKSLWGAVPTGIHNVSVGGAAPSAAIACTNARFAYVNFTNAGGSYLVAVNGVDKLKLYNGTAWSDIDGTSTPAITGVATTELSYVSQHKRRLWFIRKNTLTAYYLGIDAIGGALTAFSYGGIFRLGGSLVAQASWTIDGGNGSDDYQVTVTSEGELAIYRGIDPATADSWELVGVYQIGAPLGPKCLVKFGGDLVYTSQSGIVELSKVLRSAVIGREQALSGKIQRVISDSAALYANNFGWQGVMFPTENALIVNVPVVTNNTQYQYCMNTITKAWTRFIGWNADCFEVWNNKLYFGTVGKVCQAWVGTSDSGAAINGEAQQAYNSFRLRGHKQITLTRPNIAISGSVNLQIRFDTDFETDPTFSQINIGSSGTALWDSATWDSAQWGGDLEQLQSLWLSINNRPGYFQSFRLRVQTSVATFTWTSTDFVVRAGGIL